MEAFKSALSEATHMILTGLGGFLPRVLVMLLALVAFTLLGWVLGACLGRLLRGLRWDERLQAKGYGSIAEWSPRNSPTALARQVVTWSFVLIGWLVGVSAFEVGQTPPVTQSALSYVPRIATAVVIISLGSVLARFLSRGVLIGAVNMQLQSARMLGAAARWLVMVLVVAVVLEHLRIAPQVVRLAFAILFGGIVLAAALAVGLGSREQVSRSWAAMSRDRSEKRSGMRHV
jgi:hypothetical protein